MSAFYTKMANTSLQLISKYGQTCQLVKFDDTFDSVTGRNTASTKTEQEVKAAVFPPSETTPSATTFTEGLIEKADEYGIIAAKGIDAPNIGDVLVKADGVNMQILALNTLSPACTPLIYDVLLTDNTRSIA